MEPFLSDEDIIAIQTIAQSLGMQAQQTQLDPNQVAEAQGEGND